VSFCPFRFSHECGITSRQAESDVAFSASFPRNFFFAGLRELDGFFFFHPRTVAFSAVQKRCARHPEAVEQFLVKGPYGGPPSTDCRTDGQATCCPRSRRTGIFFLTVFRCLTLFASPQLPGAVFLLSVGRSRRVFLPGGLPF